MDFYDRIDYEPLTQGEHHSMAIEDYVIQVGQEDLEAEWILDPYDTWRRNPFFTGTPSDEEPS